MANEQLELRPHPTNQKARQRILVGEDDGHRYEVAVPMRFKDPQSALDWLRPKDVPIDALRQGEFYFVPSENPHELFCDEEHCRSFNRHGSTWFEGTSDYQFIMERGDFSTSHYVPRSYGESWRATKAGNVAFFGRRGVAHHQFSGRPRYFVRGTVVHARGDHADLVLPAHPGGDWYEVIPNKAHGPFPVTGMSGYSD